MKRLHARVRVMTLHNECTSETSRVLTVASLQRLKMEVFIPAPADCEVRSVINFLNAQDIAPIEIHRQLCQVYGYRQHTARRSTHLLQDFSWKRFNHHHPIVRTSRPVSSIFSYISRNSFVRSASAFSERQRGRDECHSGSNPRRQTSTIHGRLAR